MNTFKDNIHLWEFCVVVHMTIFAYCIISSLNSLLQSFTRTFFAKEWTQRLTLVGGESTARMCSLEGIYIIVMLRHKSILFFLIVMNFIFWLSVCSVYSQKCGWRVVRNIFDDRTNNCVQLCIFSENSTSSYIVIKPEGLLCHITRSCVFRSVLRNALANYVSNFNITIFNSQYKSANIYINILLITKIYT